MSSDVLEQFFYLVEPFFVSSSVSPIYEFLSIVSNNSHYILLLIPLLRTCGVLNRSKCETALAAA